MHVDICTMYAGKYMQSVFCTVLPLNFWARVLLLAPGDAAGVETRPVLPETPLNITGAVPFIFNKKWRKILQAPEWKLLSLRCAVYVRTCRTHS